jgi:hypothetical protein
LAEKEMTQKQLAVQVGVSNPELRVTFLFSYSIKFMRWTIKDTLFFASTSSKSKLIRNFENKIQIKFTSLWF